MDVEVEEEGSVREIMGSGTLEIMDGEVVVVRSTSKQVCAN